ncbi:HlyD family type I secretion periplasmic adaptor subunit [Rhodobacteraceae bacterium NNCM2]|nr:HlyD family type I secretion periplasmic adaptor subunit [Coraliihabitans acroporae]
MTLKLGGPAEQQQQDDGWSARGYIRFGLVCVILLGGGLGGWAATAKLAGAVIASGHLRVEAQRQVVQHLDGGVVGEINVRNGDVVKAGDVLIRLDGTQLTSELNVLESQLFEIMARRARLLAEQADKDEIEFDPELVELAKTRDDVKSLIDGQQGLFKARLKTLKSELDVMSEREEQIQEQIEGSVAEIQSLKRQSELIDEELVSMRHLQDKGLAQASRVLSLEREAARLRGEYGAMTAQNAQLKGQVSELKIEQIRMLDSRREEAITQERELGFRQLELLEQRLALKEKLSRLDIRAPRPGVVHDMTVFALDSVIRPAEPILYIVPSDTDLLVDARIEPLHRDQVHPNQDVVLRFSAFNSRTTPELFGKVSIVSSDTSLDEQTGMTYFSAEVKLNDGEIEKLEGNEMIAGLPVEVYIQTGERTTLNYLMRPMTDYFSRALREE